METTETVVKSNRGRKPYTPEQRAEVEGQRMIAREQARLAAIEAGTRRSTRGRPRLSDDTKRAHAIEFHAKAIATLGKLSYMITKNGIPQFRHATPE